MTSPGPTPEERARYRRFVRENHPDVGGDPAVFVAGLARYRTRRRREPASPDRYDAPVVFAPRRRPRRILGEVRVLVERLWRRPGGRRRAARVR